MKPLSTILALMLIISANAFSAGAGSCEKLFSNKSSNFLPKLDSVEQRLADEILNANFYLIRDADPQFTRACNSVLTSAKAYPPEVNFKAAYFLRFKSYDRMNGENALNSKPMSIKGLDPEFIESVLLNPKKNGIYEMVLAEKSVAGKILLAQKITGDDQLFNDQVMPYLENMISKKMFDDDFVRQVGTETYDKSRWYLKEYIKNVLGQKFENKSEVVSALDGSVFVLSTEGIQTAKLYSKIAQIDAGDLGSSHGYMVRLIPSSTEYQFQIKFEGSNKKIILDPRIDSQGKEAKQALASFYKQGNQHGLILIDSKLDPDLAENYKYFYKELGYTFKKPIKYNEDLIYKKIQNNEINYILREGHGTFVSRVFTDDAIISVSANDAYLLQGVSKETGNLINIVYSKSSDEMSFSPNIAKVASSISLKNKKDFIIFDTGCSGVCRYTKPHAKLSELNLMGLKTSGNTLTEEPGGAIYEFLVGLHEKTPFNQIQNNITSGEVLDLFSNKDTDWTKDLLRLDVRTTEN